MVAGPIGHLEDITYRAVRTLAEADIVAAEDTRRARKLFSRYGIETRLISCHEHNERARAAEITRLILEGADAALISDAGTPAISDPGYRLIRAAVECGIQVTPIPGPCAAVAAASASGLPVSDFYFAGFCSPKRGRRQRRMRGLANLNAVLIFYESPHRLMKFLDDAIEIFGNRNAVAAREMTKMHEEFLRGTLDELRAAFQNRTPKGEFTILIEGDHERNATPD